MVKKVDACLENVVSYNEARQECNEFYLFCHWPGNIDIRSLPTEVAGWKEFKWDAALMRVLEIN